MKCLMVLSLFCILISAACSDSSDSQAALTLAHASSLNQLFEEFVQERGLSIRLSSGGSQLLALQIEQGAKFDVFVSADWNLIGDLHQRGLVEEPREFASNQLALIWRKDLDANASIDTLQVAKTFSVGAAETPIGKYTRASLQRMGTWEEVSRRVVSEETDVQRVALRVESGQVDAGIVYLSDAIRLGESVSMRVIDEAFQPAITYGVAVVTSSTQLGKARMLVDRLTRREYSKALEAKGFVPVQPSIEKKGGSQ